MGTMTMTMPVAIEGCDIWGDARSSADGDDATPRVQPAAPSTREGQADATRRWRRENIDETVAAFRDRCRADYLADHPGCRKRDAHEYAWSRALAEFPPPGVEPAPPAPEPPPPAPEPGPAPVAPDPPAPDPPAAADQAAPASPPAPSAGGVQGLGDIPADWPQLPANASLAAEVAWVQGNRVLVVQGGAVDLSRALSPAPSYAAIAWLETSILYPSKFADVTVKASGELQDDAEDIRRERIGIDELRTMLSEAMAAI